MNAKQEKQSFSGKELLKYSKRGTSFTITLFGGIKVEKYIFGLPSPYIYFDDEGKYPKKIIGHAIYQGRIKEENFINNTENIIIHIIQLLFDSKIVEEIADPKQLYTYEVIVDNDELKDIYLVRI